MTELPNMEQSDSPDLTSLRFFVIGAYFRGAEVLAGFAGEGTAAAFLDRQSPLARKHMHLVDRNGAVVEVVRYRENHGASYGHAIAFVRPVTQAERDKLAPSGFSFSDTGPREAI